MEDWTVRSALSWRLASELYRRHPKRVRLLRSHPGGGQYDCLTFMAFDGGPGKIYLNRAGTIQIHERFDGKPADWAATEWAGYEDADPREFLHRLESAAGLPAPATVPPTTAETLCSRVIASVDAMTIKTVHPFDIQQGFIDTSGYGGGENREAFAAFPQIAPALRAPAPTDLFGQPGYRFWFFHRESGYVAALETSSGLAWPSSGGEPLNLMKIYKDTRRSPLVVATQLLIRCRAES